jgi:hypothetical protein
VNEPLLFLHVPKAAGLSVAAVLQEQFADSEVCPRPQDDGWEAQALAGYRLYCGHFSYDFIEAFEPCTKLIMLRHPVARVISLYDYWRSYRWEYLRAQPALDPSDVRVIAKQHAFSDFLDAPGVFPNISNHAARLLLGRAASAIRSDPGTAAQRALDRLRTFDWVGTTESFGLSLVTLCALLERPPLRKLPRANLTYQRSVEESATFERVRKSRPTPAQRRRILELNQVDLALYEAASSMLHEQAAFLNRRGHRALANTLYKGRFATPKSFPAQRPKA